MLDLDLHSILVLGGCFAAYWFYTFLQTPRTNPSRLPLPPGPNGYPIIGNLLDLSTHKPWLVYDKWFKSYGDMVYFEVFGQSFLLLGKQERAYDLFERRSSNYSDRPRMPMVVELMGWGWAMTFIPYGNWWRRNRRTFHDHFHPNVVHKYQSIQINSIRTFVRRLADSPDHFIDHIRLLFGSTIMKAVYGITVQEHNDPYIEVVEQSLVGLNGAAVPGAYLVDLIPAMKYIPSWFPGAKWKRNAETWSDMNDLLVQRPFKYVNEQLNTGGTVVQSIATSLIEKLPPDDDPSRREEEIIAQQTCAIALVGGADTTLSTVQSFFMAMAGHPEVQKKAQAELDSVLEGRFPEYNDRPNLPYINAIVMESLRWQPVVPLGVVHTCTADDEYNGYHIPKGTNVIGNTWTLLHDPEVYNDPLVYNPDRFLKDGKLNPEVRDPQVAAFGYGRRICPGRYFADNSLFMIVAHVLFVFDIKPSVDEYGKEIPIEPDMTSGLLSYPLPFSCRIIPRSQMAKELIKNLDLMD